MRLNPENYIGGVVQIKDTLTGEVRNHRDEYLLTKGEPFEPYMWEEGNYSCDCNRGMFFASVKGEPDPDMPCNSAAPRFSVHIEVDGEVLYSEWGLNP